ncbi:MAG: DUF896 domain-containing protein [Oscillospiraceae bacterium]|nr:DUF896 domain-containing protein [Oscillospiraceae bacterium]
MLQEKLDRINALARLKKQRLLSPQEAEEQAALRKEYLEEWRRGAIQVLENTWIVDEQGNKRKLQAKGPGGGA